MAEMDACHHHTKIPRHCIGLEESKRLAKEKRAVVAKSKRLMKE